MGHEYDIRDKANIRLGLIAARKNASMTQQQLADKAFMSRSQLAAVELGTRNPCDDTWKRIKVVLKVKSVEELWEKYTYKEGMFIGDDGGKIKDPRYEKQQYVNNDEHSNCSDKTGHLDIQ